MSRKNFESVSKEYLLMSKLWTSLACASLLLSGALALIITFAKMPGFKELVQDIDLIRWCLAVHVNLATLVWFTALPLGLVHLAVEQEKTQSKVYVVLSSLGLFLSLAGIILFVTALPGIGIEVIMSNYVPVVTHPRFFIGLILYSVGVAINYLSPRVLWPRQMQSQTPGLAESRFGLWIGTAFFLMALVAMGFSLYEVVGVEGLSQRVKFESLMWGSGHLLQHSSVAFLLVCWVLISSEQLGQPLFTRDELFRVFAWLGLPIFFTPWILQYSVFSEEYRSGFTDLMRWGMAPPVLYFIFQSVLKFKRLKVRVFADYKVPSVLLSMVLIVVGFVFGALIRGTDMRVPGHYHAVIGAVTIAFMAMSYHLLSKKHLSTKWITRSIWTYGVGQFLFSAGMFTAGTFGMGRKTYGAEHTLGNMGQQIGFGIMAIGGLIAFAGGLFFAFSIIPRLRYFTLYRIT